MSLYRTNSLVFVGEMVFLAAPGIPRYHGKEMLHLSRTDNKPINLHPVHDTATTKQKKNAFKAH